MPWPFKILLKLTTRGRTAAFFEALDSAYSLCSQPDYLRTLITADEDDPAMTSQDIYERISRYPNTHIIYGKSESKVHAINRDMDLLPEEWKDWEIIANYSDDQRFTIYGWDEIIRTNFNSVFPETLDGFMAYLDVDTKSALSTLYIAGRRWYDRFGFIYDPQFKSLFCDNLVEDCAKHLGKYHYTGFTIYHHWNPSYYSHIIPDQMYLDQQRIGWDIDEKLYYKIKGAGIENYLKKYL